ncbi:uncharacterized protein At4g26485-like [Populus nigra]|uniref:uncharacterized protein At4g26485-like n=1 Tax=Populus nigra TaxID=3691 RepID=UPI002B26ABA7|nr:uncharacterized protein At4g26485-like [Populus nigra]
MLGPRPKLNRHCMHMDYWAIKLEPFTKWIKHYSSCHKILLVGESDYSFAVCLAKAFGSATNIKTFAKLRVVKRLVKGFLKSAHDKLEENEEIQVIHKTTYPFKKWEIEKSAEDAGLFLVKKVNFRVSDYPGYENKIG